MLIIHFSLKKMFLLFLLSQRHIHPADVETRPNGLTINMFNSQYSNREDC